MPNEVPPAPPAELSLRDFAAHIGCRPSYVTELKRVGRLVLTEDGKRVRVAESIALIEATRDPARAGVAERHAAARAAAAAVSVPDDDDDDDDGDAPGAAADELVGRAGKVFQVSRAKRESTRARREERLEAIELGKLLHADDVRRQTAIAATVLRAGVERLIDTLPPQLAAVTDEHDHRRILQSEFRHLLEEAARSFDAMSQSRATA